jgi:hypothetical protein
LTTAACGGLRSAPDCRTRRAFLHLPYSYAAPCGPALLVTQDPCPKCSVQRSRGNNDDLYAAGDASLNRCRAGAQLNRPISGHRYTCGLAAWRCPNSVVFVLISLWRHSSEWRGSRSYLVGGLERDPAPVQKQTEHIEPADHKHNFSRDRLAVPV